MTVYFIGDVQGCDKPLERLLQHIDFSPSRDTLYLAGDLVNRGANSAAVLRRLAALEGAAQCVLGNHDWHLLAVAAGVRKSKGRDTLTPVLQAPDCEAMLTWLRQQRMAILAHGVLMVHAGVLPQWDVAQTLRLAAELEGLLRGPPALLHAALPLIFGSEPVQWVDDLQGTARLRIILNTLTRLRFCTPEGQMEFDAKEGADQAPAGYMPWFDVPGRKTQSAIIAFGHWSTLGWLNRSDVYSLDSGCAWGGCLTALRWDTQRQCGERLSVKCDE